LCDTATVYITVLPVPTPSTNNPPVAVLDMNTTFVDIAVNGNVLTNDFDIDGDSIFVTVMPLDTTQNGGLTWLGNGDYTYTPNVGFAGLDSFTYIICDAGIPSLCDTTTVYITVLPLPNTGVNNAPIANNDAGVTPVNTPISGDVSNNDFDPDFDVLTFTLLTNPTNGTLTTTLNPVTGSFTYTPNTNYIGLDTFYYVACDGGTPTLCDTAMVVITVIPDLDTLGNDRPFAGDDAFITNVDVPITGQLFPNDYDPNGDPFTITAVSIPGNGVVVSNPFTGQFIYTPNPGYSGPDYFTYVICDNGTPSLCDTATVYILVIPEPYKAPDTVYVTIPVTLTDTFCVPVGLIDLVGAVDSIEYIACAPLTFGTVVSVNDSCFVYTAFGTPSLLNNDTVCIVLYDSLGNTDTTVFIINVTPDCSAFSSILPPALTVLAPNCLGDGEVCIPIAPNTIGNYDIFLNDSLYNLTSTSVGCDNDSTYFVNLGMVPSSVATFSLTWTVNGIVNGPTAFTNVSQVLPWVQGINPTGNWTQSGMTITGFGSGTNYGSMMAQYILPSTGTLTNVNINNFSASATGTQVILPVGTHQLIVVNPLTGCADTAIITVLCTTVDTIPVIVQTNSVTTLCPPGVNDLPGSIFTMQNICPDAADNGTFVYGSTCFDYIAGGVAGYDTACIVVCDELGICDTTYYIITVVPTPDTVVLNLILGQDSTLCIPISELPTSLVSISVGTNCDLLDSADLIISGLDTCVLIVPGALGSDTTCIVICDSLGFCDTTYIIVNVIDGIEPPIAVNDTVATITQTGDAPPFAPNPININVLSNDTIPGSLISISVITPPLGGTAIVLPDGTIDYTQLEKCPYIDSFSYEICNGAGCDTAWVFLDIICNDIIIYTGFSPNGDGVNDNFTIDGIEEYPNNRLIIFNRWGNRVYLKDSYLNDWGGTWDDDKVLPDGTYFYILELNDDKSRKFSGYIQIQR
jgi:gliding motility-associated-like protein